MTTRSSAAPDRGDRVRRGRTDGRPRGCPHRARHALRGRLAARRPRRHPRGGRPGDRHRLHRAQRAHLPDPAPAVRRGRRRDPAVGDVDVGARRGDGPGVRRRPRSARACSRPRATCAGRRTCGCWARCRASTGGRGRCSRSRPTPEIRRCGSFSPTAASRRTSAGSSWSRSSRRSGRATPRWPWTTPRATSSSSSPTTACSRSPALRSGAPSSAALGVRRAGRGRAPRRARRHQGHLGPRDPGRRAGHRRQRPRPRRTTRWSSRPIPTRRWRCSTSRHPPSDVLSRPCPTPTTSPCCTPTRRSCRGPSTRGPRGTSCAPALRVTGPASTTPR